MLPVNETETKKIEATRSSGIINPFEQLGVQHNEALDFVGQTPNLIQLSRYEKYEVVYTFNQNYYSTNKMTFEEFSIFAQKIDDLVAAGINAPSELEKNGKINTRMKNLLTDLYEILLTGYDQNSPLPPTAMVTALKAFESRLIVQFGMPDSNLNSNTDIATVLAGVAIAKYSYTYWYNASIVPTSPWNPVVGPTPVGIKWWDVVKADVGGFFSGDCFDADSWVWDLNCAGATANAASASAK